ncbi:MAG: tRNA (adenosine(37)-N6)-threonylcarbamoyltransferase complex ATPase subunit type 1 TsaE [Frankiales bacterium]|nr:tRNA (adenosine(37)-N6)-threonylcarbamoyltransferase complex ATPase subunit type 1 TsaE [Frankiales bacterium]
MTSVVVPTREAMHDLGDRLAGVLQPGDLVVLSGGLGAGKTTLTQGIGRGLQVRGDVTSPTFVISRVHPSTVAGPSLVHVDAYRLGSLAEVDDLDLEATLDSAVTVVEWGGGVVEGLSEDRLLVHIDRAPGDASDDVVGDVDEPRVVTVAAVGPRWEGVDLDPLVDESLGGVDPEQAEPDDLLDLEP